MAKRRGKEEKKKRREELLDRIERQNYQVIIKCLKEQMEKASFDPPKFFWLEEQVRGFDSRLSN